jgi:leucyl/phenylalanyl-tRNA---protein transferase
MSEPRLDPQTLLSAYAQGVFPMADHRGVIRWYTADPRGILPLESFHISQTLSQLVRNPKKFTIQINLDFPATMRACREQKRGGQGGQGGTWINDRLIAAYTQLHEMGHAHSVETYWEGELVGGLYGVSLGGAFFGESMFHRRRDASKLALVKLVERLRERGFVLLDAQASTSHLRTFGCIEIPAAKYLELLDEALKKECVFD